MDFKKQQREYPPIHITAVEKVERFKFLGVHITDKLKWSTHTDSVVTKSQQRNPDELLQMHNRRHPVGLYHHLVQQLHCPQPQGSSEGGVFCPTHHWGHIACPPCPLQHPMSQKGQKDPQDILDTACSPRYHPEGEVSTGASKQGPGV